MITALGLRRGALGICLLAAAVAFLPAGVAQRPARAARSAIGLERAHAHNDYEHARPLYDALDNGFKSVEADIYLVGDQLLIGHDPADLQPGRTLQSLYLNPLRQRVRSNEGSVYRGDRHYFNLLIDVKTEPVSTYLRLDEVLAKYRSILTRFSNGDVTAKAVTAVVSGNRARPLMESQTVRYAFYDGRLSDLGTRAAQSLIPLISDNWTNNFTWDGSGPMPDAEREKLQSIVATAHADGQRVRFYATPDQPGPERDAIWKELMAARVDYLNTDDLAGLRSFLLTNDPRPAVPYVNFGDGEASFVAVRQRAAA